MIINEKQFFDYIECPTKYQMRHVNNMEISENKNLRSLIKIVTNYFFASIYNQKIPTIDSLKKRWDRVCEENIDYIDQKKNLEGIGILVNLYNYALERKLVVLSHNSAYSIDTNNNNKLIGNLDNPIVAVDETNGLELLVPYYSNRIPKSIDLDTKMKYSIDSIGFELAQNERIDGITIIMLKKMNEYKTNRNHLDHERLKYAIDGVVKGIENEVFYPRESAFCDSCTAKAICRYWNG